MKFFYETKGVISVFLIIVMLPLFTSAVLLVDGARYQSARTIVQEAGDIAAYSTISDYNIDLKDKYGLFAIADSESVSSDFEKYFKESLGYSASSGEEYSQKIQGLIKGVIGANEYKDAKFFNLYNFNGIVASAQAMHDLADPDVLQSQIVEFMKYRGVETVLERFDIISNATQMAEEMKKNKQLNQAIEDLSGVDTRYGNIANMIGSLITQIKEYNSALDTATLCCNNYLNAVIDELVEVAFRSDSVASKRNSRKDFYTGLTEATSIVSTKYEAVKATTERIIENATEARGKYQELRNKYKDQPEICKDIDKELEILNKILKSDTTEKTSIVYFQSRLYLPSEDLGNINTIAQGLNQRLEKAHNDFNREYNKEASKLEEEGYTKEEIELELLHIVYFMDVVGHGNNWKYTQTFNPVATETETEIRSSAYNELYKLRLDEAGELGNYDCPTVENYYDKKAEEEVEDYKSDPDHRKEDSVEDKEQAGNVASKANGRGKEEVNPEKSPVKLKNDVLSKLPSRLAGKGEEKEKEVSQVEENNATNTISSANSISNELMGAIETGRDELLTFCYIFDMFKTRVTGKKIGVVDGADHKNFKDTSHNQWYHTKWRYSDPRGEVDSRDRVKNDLSTVFNTNEIEYVFTGSGNESTNGAVVYSWIYGTRLANNLVAVYLNKNAKAQCEALAAASSAAIAGTVPPAVFKWVYIAAWAAGETALELAYLIDDGYRIPLVKTNKLYIENFWDITNALSEDKRKNLINSDLKSAINVCYEDYLLILLCFVGSDTRLLRVADLIQLNMNGGDGSGDFAMNKANTYISAKTEVQFKYLFQPIQQFKNSYKGTGISLKNTVSQGY